MYRNDLFGVQQRVTRLFEVNDTVRIEYRLGTLIIFCKLCLGKNEIQPGENLLIFLQISGAAGGLRTQSLQDLLNLRLLLHVKLFDLIIELHDCHWLDKQRGTGRRLVVDHSLEGVLILCLDRHTVTAVSHGDQRILQDRLVALRINDGRQLIMNGDVCLSDLFADVPQSRGSIVADLIRG